MRRAAHQLFDAPPLVFTDPFAVRILGPHAAEIERTPGRDPANKPRPFSIALRAFLVARSRYAEEKLAHAVENGATQYVILGAGLDTFALRNPHPHLRVLRSTTQPHKPGSATSSTKPICPRPPALPSFPSTLNANPSPPNFSPPTSTPPSPPSSPGSASSPTSHSKPSEPPSPSSPRNVPIAA